MLSLRCAVVFVHRLNVAFRYGVTTVAPYSPPTTATLSGGAIVTRMGRDPPFAGLGRAGLLAREIERDRRPQGEGPPQI